MTSMPALEIGNTTDTVGAMVDRDSTCAIAAGVAAMALGWDGIPAAWRAAREALPAE